MSSQPPQEDDLTVRLRALARDAAEHSTMPGPWGLMDRSAGYAGRMPGLLMGLAAAAAVVTFLLLAVHYRLPTSVQQATTAPRPATSTPAPTVDPSPSVSSSPTTSSTPTSSSSPSISPSRSASPSSAPSSSPAPAGWTYPTVSWDSGTVPLGETMALDLPTGWTARAIISAANTTTLTPGERTNAICVHDPANTDELGPRCDVLIQFGPHIQGYGGTPWTPGQTDAWWHIGPDMYSCIVKSPPSATLPLFLVGVPGPVTTGTGTIGAWPATTWTYPAGCIDEPGTAPKVTLTPKVWWNATHQIYADAELPSDRTTTLLATIRATR
ncbi:MAG: hypothetical protein U0Q14_02705 [Dermatophilaceae bacterium]